MTHQVQFLFFSLFMVASLQSRATGCCWTVDDASIGGQISSRVVASRRASAFALQFDLFLFCWFSSRFSFILAAACCIVILSKAIFGITFDRIIFMPHCQPLRSSPPRCRCHRRSSRPHSRNSWDFRWIGCLTRRLPRSLIVCALFFGFETKL